MGHKSRFVLLAITLGVWLVGPAGAEPRPVVLELYTSEGCSSCPPAEVMVNELAQRHDVLPLTFHVDYWDSLGWRDRYSLASATERQRVYARTMRRSSVYTPQVIIDGSRDIIGSQRSTVMQAISGQRDGVPITVSIRGGTIRILVGADFQLSADSLPEHATDIAVLVQSAGQGSILGAVTRNKEESLLAP